MKKYFILLMSLLIIPISVNAASATINLEANNTKVKTGDSVTVDVTINSSANIGYYEYTLDYNNDYLKLVKGNNYTVDRPNNATKKITKSFKFRTLKQGNSKISVKTYAVLDTKDKNISANVKPVTLNISGTNSSNNSGSTYLTSLEIDDYDLSPKFNKTTTSYNVDINDDISSVNISAETEDPDATLKGDGKISLISGTNKIKLTVTNDDDERTYTININLKDSNPIKVTIDNKEYTVVKNLNDIKIPKGFIEKEITIEGQKVIALYNDLLDLTLVGLQNEDGDLELYIYDEDTNSYSPYIVLNFSEVSFYPLTPKDIPENYSKYNITINDTDLDCYKLTSDSKFALLYGINTETGEEGWYSYNEDENTLQKYNSEIDDYYQDKIQNTQVLIYILAGTTLLFGIIVIILAVKLNQKKSRKIKN